MTIQLPISFNVRAKGSYSKAQPYEMTVEVAPEGITIDGLKLSWNDARCAFDTQITYGKHQQALFGRRK